MYLLAGLVLIFSGDGVKLAVGGGIGEHGNAASARAPSEPGAVKAALRSALGDELHEKIGGFAAEASFARAGGMGFKHELAGLHGERMLFGI